MTPPVPGFLRAAATAPHQVEGNNVDNDRWDIHRFGIERARPEPSLARLGEVALHGRP